MEKISINEQYFLKKQLADAIQNNNKEEIIRLSKVLNIPEEQTKYFTQGMTGYPSIDQVWLNYYPEGAYEKATNIPLDKTIWDVIEQKLLEYYDIPAIEYFKKQITRPDFIDLVDTWARTFRAMGVEEDDVVPIYGPFFPDIGAMLFALITIGASGYFLKIGIDQKSLVKETEDAKIAVVFDEMWNHVAEEFSKNKFKKIIVATASDAMPSPKKEIVSFLSYIKSKKEKSRIPNDKKYIWLDDAKKMQSYYTGEVKVPFKSNRTTVITSSSGTTNSNLAKGTMATNESMISQLYMSSVSGVQYYPGDICLCPYPLTASTTMNTMFLMPLFNGMTIALDPRISLKDFYNQIMTYKPSIVLTTGSMWELFFNLIEKEMKNGKKFDFSYAKGWTIGGEGTDVKKYKKWNEIMIRCGAKGIYSGYGLSEVFSSATVETVDVRCNVDKNIMSVGIPFAGVTAGIYDKDGNELSYNQRGELRLTSQSAMKGYYKKPELTAKTKIGNVICTGDLAEIDENGQVYIYGRKNDVIRLSNGKELYLFDLANKFKELDFINDAVVLRKPTVDNEDNLVAHIVFKDNYDNETKKEYLNIMNQIATDCLSEFGGALISAYAIHEEMLPFASIALKKDKNKMMNQDTGYIQVIDGQLYNVEFNLNNDGKYSQKCAIIKESKVKSLRK